MQRHVCCAAKTHCTIKLSPSPQKQSSQMRRPRSTAGCSGTPLRTHWEPSVITAPPLLFRLPGKGTPGKCPHGSNTMVRGDWPGASPGRQSPKSTVQPTLVKGSGSPFLLSCEDPDHMRAKFPVLAFQQFGAGAHWARAQICGLYTTVQP